MGNYTFFTAQEIDIFITILPPWKNKKFKIKDLKIEKSHTTRITNKDQDKGDEFVNMQYEQGSC